MFTYEPLTGKLFWNINKRSIKAGMEAGSDGSEGYRMVAINKKKRLVHRVIFKMQTGEAPAKVDHKDGNRSNNVWTNLRAATNSQNGANQGNRRNNKTGFKGVYFDKRVRKFRAQIRNSKGIVRLGAYPSAEDAHKAYCAAADAFHGEFANHG
jgi:hypothetical protein